LRRVFVLLGIEYRSSPIQYTEHLRSGGATVLKTKIVGAYAGISQFLRDPQIKLQEKLTLLFIKAMIKK
jgi:hypothetical protein